MNLSWKIDDDRQNATLIIDSNPPVTVRLDATAIESLIHALGDVRSLMLPAVPREFPVGQKVEAVSNFGWASEREARQGSSLLHLGHSGFGWLHFLFTREQAAKLGAFMQAQAASPKPARLIGRLN